MYIWRAKGDQVGHASMELGDGTYVSLWPGEGKAGKKKKYFYDDSVTNSFKVLIVGCEMLKFNENAYV